MATVLDERYRVDLSEKMGADNLDPWNDSVSERLDSQGKSNPDDIENSVSKFEVILPIDESEVSQETLDFAIQTVRNFSGKLVLMYVTERSKVPSGFLDFAIAEGIRDYEWHYYNSLANDKLGNIAKKAADAGIDWVGHVHLGGIKSAVKHYNHNKGRC